MRIEHLWQVMFRSGFFPANRIGAAAISAIDIALCNIDGGGADLQSQRIARGCAANQYE
mgnify:CR=1 FL=1